MPENTFNRTAEPDCAMKKLFVDWPEKIERRGVMITTLNESIVFAGFLTSPGLLLLERATPDTTGARTVILPYDHVAAVKLTDVIDVRNLRDFGFVGK